MISYEINGHRFEWFPRTAASLATVDVRPWFLRTALLDIPASVRHVPHADAEAAAPERT